MEVIIAFFAWLISWIVGIGVALGIIWCITRQPGPHDVYVNRQDK